MYSLDVLLFLFGISLLFHVNINLLKFIIVLWLYKRISTITMKWALNIKGLRIVIYIVYLQMVHKNVILRNSKKENK